MDIIGIVLGILKAIPILDSWFKDLSLAYLNQQIASHNADFVEANRALVQEYDQRKLEEAAGSDNAGKPALDQGGVQTRPRGPHV